MRQSVAMFSFFRREVPAVGRVWHPGAIPPPLEQLSGLAAPVTMKPQPSSDVHVWRVEACHPAWGAAEIACFRQAMPPVPELIDHTVSLTDDERNRARQGHATIAVGVPAQQNQILADRKRLLFWLRALLQPGGAIALDDISTLFWSPAMLDDELAHDADLDIESLYTIHAVRDAADATRVSWLHTHGLEELGAFDVDVLRPSREFVDSCADAIRALAFGGLEGTIAPDADRFPLAFPGGDIRLVPVDRFHADAAPEHRRLRDQDEVHSGRRSVVCEPAGGLFSRWRARTVPSRFLSSVADQGFVVPFSTAATRMMAERAQRTFQVFRRLHEEFAACELPALVKLGYEVEGGSPTDREHLWFLVHDVRSETVDATLANAPHRVPSLRQGQRGDFPLERLTDWTIQSPEGPMTPRNVSAARRMRDRRAGAQARVDAAGAPPGAQTPVPGPHV